MRRNAFRGRLVVPVLLAIAAAWLGHPPTGQAGERKDGSAKPRKFSDVLRAIWGVSDATALRPPKAPRPKKPAPPKRAAPKKTAPKKTAPKKPPAAPLPPKTAPARTAGDPTYGYTKDNPIKVGLRGEKGDETSALLAGVRAEKLYLRHLRDAKLRPFRSRRHGSFMGKDGHIVDRYELLDQDGKQHVIYIDMYHPEAGVLKVPAPKGMRLWVPQPEPPAR